jgi:glyoxylase-like metal-dependent hydrolase (beta-lactamase superfamily II)
MRVTGELQRQAWLEGRLPPIEQVRSGLWSVPVPVPRSPLRYTLTYVMETATGLLVLDPGWDVDEAWQALLGGLTTIGAAVSDVRGVVVTHVHPDHHGLSARLREASGAWVAMHPAEAATLPARVWATGDRGHQDEEWLRRCGLPPDVVAELVLPPEAMKTFLAMAEPDRLLEDGDLVPGAGRPLRAVWTPGHTPGHLCFHDETDDLLLRWCLTSSDRCSLMKMARVLKTGSSEALCLAIRALTDSASIRAWAGSYTPQGRSQWALTSRTRSVATKASSRRRRI